MKCKAGRLRVSVCLNLLLLASSRCDLGWGIPTIPCYFIAYCECLLVFSSNGKFVTFTSRNVCLFISVFLVKVDIQDM